jgi:hypothetical protein
LRRAPNDAKAPRLSALRATACSFNEVCELKRVCLEAYERHLAALQGSHAAQTALGADAGTKTSDVARLVLSSEKQLEKGRELQKQCLAAQGSLKRAFDL